MELELVGCRYRGTSILTCYYVRKDYLKMKSTQRIIYVRPGERIAKCIDWAAGSSYTWTDNLDFSLTSANKFLGFVFNGFQLSIKRILISTQFIHPNVHSSNSSQELFCTRHWSLLLGAHNPKKEKTPSSHLEVISSVFLRIWTCHGLLGQWLCSSSTSYLAAPVSWNLVRNLEKATKNA